MKKIVKINYRFNDFELDDLKQQMKELGFSYRGLSKLIGICPSYIADLLTGRNDFNKRTIELFRNAGFKIEMEEMENE